MGRIAALLLFLPTLWAQTSLIFQPQTLPKKAKLDAGVWAVIACPPAPVGAGNVFTVPAGIVYGIMQKHGIGFRLNSEANDLLHAARERDPRSRVVRYIGYAAVGVAISMQLKFVQTNDDWLKGATAAAGFLNTVLPMAQKNVPTPASWEAMLLRDTDELKPPPNGCAAPVIVLGDYGAPFTAVYP